VALVRVSAVIVTRGDVNLDRIIEGPWPEPFTEIVVWDNSVETDMKVYGRYAAIKKASHPVIYVQDDDCILPLQSLQTLVDAYEPGRLVANMPRSRWEGYPDSSLLGWGAIFDAHLPRESFGKLPHLFVREDDREWFHLTCDVAFSALSRRTVIDVPFVHLPWAEGPDRMFTGRPTHSEERERMLELCRSVRGEDDDRRDW
jgi:hypothetical protein